MITLTFGGSMRVMPNYNVMGVAKAALEASCAISPPILGRAAFASTRSRPARSGRWRDRASPMRGDVRVPAAHSPLGRAVTLEDLGGSALYFLSDLSGGVTGEIHYVDSGYNIISMPRPDELKKLGE